MRQPASPVRRVVPARELRCPAAIVVGRLHGESLLLLRNAGKTTADSSFCMRGIGMSENSQQNPDILRLLNDFTG